MLTSYGKTRNSALASALSSPRRGGSSGSGSPTPKRKERAGSDAERVPEEGEGGGAPDRRPPHGHPDGTPLGIVVAKVVERGARSDRSSFLATADILRKPARASGERGDERLPAEAAPLAGDSSAPRKQGTTAR